MIGQMSSKVDVDFRGSSWIAIREWTRQKLDACRIKNDAALSESETALLRGAIQAYKDLLALEITPPPAQPSDDAAGRPRGEIATYDK